MADQLFDNLTKALEQRAPQLASAQDPAAVRTLLDEAETEAKANTPIFYTDKYIYRLTVTVLGVSILAVIAAQLWISLVKTVDDIPDGIIAIGSAAIGALAGLLAPTPSS